MKPDNAFMLELTANMPCKQINITRERTKSLAEAVQVFGIDGYIGGDDGIPYRPYLQRYYAGKFVNQIGETDLWFHRFLSGDGDEHLHWHPMNMQSSIICGSYCEEYLDKGDKAGRFIYPSGMTKNYIINAVSAAQKGWPLRKSPKNSRSILMHDIHRIAEVDPETWTMLFVEPERVPVWGFIDDHGGYEVRKGSPRDWWKDYKPRGFNLGDVL